MAPTRESTIYYSPQLRALWPEPLAAQWAALYPDLFDADDLRITRRQPSKHFNEWFAAIHLFQRDGVLCLVEKYAFATHPRKKAVVSRLLSDSIPAVAEAVAPHHQHARDFCGDLITEQPLAIGIPACNENPPRHQTQHEGAPSASGNRTWR